MHEKLSSLLFAEFSRLDKAFMTDLEEQLQALHLQVALLRQACRVALRESECTCPTSPCQGECSHAILSAAAAGDIDKLRELLPGF